MSACAPVPPGPSPNRFVAESVSWDHQVRFASGHSDRLGEAELERLRQFFEDADSDRAGTIFIVSGNVQVAQDRRTTIREMVQSTGRRLSGIGTASLPPEIVAIRVRRDILLPTSCLETDGWPSADDLPAGCANDLNLLAMVEDDRDLSRGRTLGLAPAAPAGDLVRNYLERFRQPPPESEEALPSSPFDAVSTFIE